MAESFDVGFAGEPSFAKATDGRGSAVNIVQTLAEGGERSGGILAVLLRADGCAEHVVEVRGALRGSDRVAASDMRLVDELLVAALDEGEAVPLEGFGLRRARSVHPTMAAHLLEHVARLAADAT